METFARLLNWQLKPGSHRFPGEDGGTCINEAAIVASGFKYHEVRFVDQMPRCFSRPVCQLALQLNDRASDEERQRLLPYVTRLACADTLVVELKRELYIAWHTWIFSWSFERALRTLEGAIALGRQAAPLGLEEVRTRMESVRARSETMAAVPQSDILASAFRRRFIMQDPVS